jgi:hypothetical protein
MSQRFRIAALAEHQIAQAYPVVQAVRPDITLEQWRAFAAVCGAGRRPRAASGIMTVQDQRGYIRGLFSYSIERDLNHGRILLADNVIMLGMGDRGRLMAVLLEAMESLARQHGCAAIRTHLREAVDATDARLTVAERFRDGGHRIVGLTLCKTIGP